MALRVLHLVGSAVDDFYCDLSRLYASGCLDAVADPARYDPVVAYVTPDGLWRFPADLSAASIAAAAPVRPGEALARIAEAGVEVVVPQMFCLPGMTSYRAVWDVLGIPMVGNTAPVMALGAHKARAKAVVAAAGVVVPAGEVLRRGEAPSVAPPAVVKPVDADNSIGLGLVRRSEDWGSVLAAAFDVSDGVLVESYVELGREVRCGIVVRDGKPVCLPLEEYAVDPVTKPVRGPDDKIAGRGGDMRLVAKDATRAWVVDPADPVTDAVWPVALRAHEALGCRNHSLFDFRIDPSGRPWWLEASLYCSYAPSSVVSVMAAAAGIGLSELFAVGVAEALAGR